MEEGPTPRMSLDRNTPNNRRKMVDARVLPPLRRSCTTTSNAEHPWNRAAVYETAEWIGQRVSSSKIFSRTVSRVAGGVEFKLGEGRERERRTPRRVITEKESIGEVGGRETKVESRSKGTREEAGRRERDGETEATNRSAMPGREGDGGRGRKRGEREQEERHEREPGTSGVLGRSVERAITSTRDAWALSLDGQAESVSRSYARPRALPASPPERNARTSLTPE